MGRNYARGANRERDLKRNKEADGDSVTRSAGSRSPHDLALVRPARIFGGVVPGLCEVDYVQVKADIAGPYAHFGPAARKELSAEAHKAGAKAWLVWWPPGGSPQWIPESDWP